MPQADVDFNNAVFVTNLIILFSFLLKGQILIFLGGGGGGGGGGGE